MRYATALVAALTLGAAASLHTSKAEAGVLIRVAVPVPSVIAAPAPYYPYVPGAVVGFGVRCCGPVFGHPFYAPAFGGAGFYRPGYLHRGYYHGGVVHGYRR